MANYAVTDWVSNVKPLIDVASEIEIYLETVDNSKTIRLINVIQVGNNAQAIIIHDA